jgi:dTDP-4-amino-4,6-dideoxygalactose transaminase
MASILINDFSRIPAFVRQELLAAAAGVLQSGWFILGENVAAFEREWAEYCSTKHCIGVANGMDALEIGLRCAGIGPGDEVITTPLTAFATVLAILRAGAQPVLADIDPATGLLDPESAARCIGPRTRAILLVHLYGQVRQMDRWQALCRERGVLLLEDAAQAHGACARGVSAGGFGCWAGYSFYPTKNLGAIGDAGALCTNDDAVAAQAAQLRNYGQSDRYHHPVAGLNSRLDELQAAMLRRLVAHLPASTRRRREIAALYRAEVRNPAITLLAPPEEDASHVYHLFVVRTARRDALASHLREAGIQSLIHYPIGAHRQPPTSGLRRDPAGLVAADEFSATCLSIPCHPFLDAAEVRRVVDALNSFR